VHNRQIKYENPNIFGFPSIQIDKWNLGFLKNGWSNLETIRLDETMSRKLPPFPFPAVRPI
jgi:hypothetical protein